MPVNQMGGVQQDLAQIIALMPNRPLTDYQDIVARLESADMLIDQTMALLKRGLKAGITPAAITLRDVSSQVANQIFVEFRDSTLLRPFTRFPKNITIAQQAQLIARAKVAYRERIVPAYKALQRFLDTDDLPNTLTTVGISNLANGQARFAHRAARSITRELSAERIQALGLSEVARICATTEQVIVESEFEGDFNAITHFLCSDPRFYLTYKADLMREYRDIAKRADAELPALFGVLTRPLYGVKIIPSYVEKPQTTAYYQPSTLSSGQLGNLFCQHLCLRHTT